MDGVGGPPILSTPDALVQASFLVQSMLERRAADHDLSLSQTRLLGILRDRRPSMQELAALLGLDKSSTTGLVSRAQRRGLVDRRPSPTDGRSVLVALTAVGRRQVAEVAAQFGAEIAELVEPLTDAERATLTELLGRLVVAHAAGRGIDLLSDGPQPQVDGENRWRYDAIGSGYALLRREDPAIRALVHRALGDGRTVVNVGAGAGSYEPRDRHVIAIEPSDVMASQRSPALAPAIRASAGALPLRDGTVDAAMAILTVHHWGEDRERGVRELRRVARGPVVILTFDPVVSGEMWLAAEYLPEVAALDREIFPPPERIAAWLGGRVDIQVVPVSATTPDWTFAAFWAHPERVLDPAARAVTSGFARMAPDVVERAVSTLAADLRRGSWDARHGNLRSLPELDVGLRLIVAR